MDLLLVIFEIFFVSLLVLERSSIDFSCVVISVDIVFWNILNVGIEIGASLAARPELQAYYDRVAAFPPLAEYLASERRFPVPGTTSHQFFHNYIKKHSDLSLYQGRPGYYDRVKNTMPWLFGAGSPPPMTSSVWNYKSK